VTDPVMRLREAAALIRNAAADVDQEIAVAYSTDYSQSARALLSAPIGKYAALFTTPVGFALAAWLESEARTDTPSDQARTLAELILAQAD